MSCSELDVAVARARVAGGLAAKSLFDLANEDSNELDEAEFIDGVARNLERGKAIVAVVGDGTGKTSRHLPLLSKAMRGSASHLR
jgi:hypothetical protein